MTNPIEPISKPPDETVLGVRRQGAARCPKCRMRRLMTSDGYRCWRCDEWTALRASLATPPTEAPK